MFLEGNNDSGSARGHVGAGKNSANVAKNARPHDRSYRDLAVQNYERSKGMLQLCSCFWKAIAGEATHLTEGIKAESQKITIGRNLLICSSIFFS